MKRGVSSEQFSRRVNRALQQFSPGCVILATRHGWFSFFFFEPFCCSKREANSLHSGVIANGRARRQGRRGEPVYWSEAETLDGTRPGPGAGSCGEGNLRGPF